MSLVSNTLCISRERRCHDMDAAIKRQLFEQSIAAHKLSYPRDHLDQIEWRDASRQQKAAAAGSGRQRRGNSLGH